MWFAGRTKGSLQLAAERKYGIGMFLLPDDFQVKIMDLWRQLWKEAGHKEPMPRSFLTRSVYVAETDEQAYQEVGPYLPQAYSWGEGKYPVGQIGAKDTYIPVENEAPDKQVGFKMHHGMRSHIDFWLENNLAYVGSPATVVRKIRESQRLIGYSVFGGRFRFGPMPSHLVEKSLSLFGTKVIPQFH